MSSYPTVDKKKLNELETKLGYHFRNVELLERALTHTSYANEQGLNAAHNERQEFLGDAVMELCVSAELFRRFPDTREGDLTRLRSSLVSTHSFANFARQTGIDRLLFLGRGEEAQGGRTRDTNLSDVFEAVMAAIYQDGGFEACQKTVARAQIWRREAVLHAAGLCRPEPCPGLHVKRLSSRRQEIYGGGHQREEVRAERGRAGPRVACLCGKQGRRAGQWKIGPVRRHSVSQGGRVRTADRKTGWQNRIRPGPGECSGSSDW